MMGSNERESSPPGVPRRGGMEDVMDECVTQNPYAGVPIVAQRVNNLL